MRIQSRFIILLLFFAFTASVGGGKLASSFYVRTINVANFANRVDDHAYPPAVYTNQDGVPPVTPPLPDTVMNTELTALDGSTFKLADYQGKVVLVNLWATWCGPCRSEIPNLVKIKQEFRARGLEVIGLTNEDPLTYAENVRDFVDDYRITYKIGWIDQSFALALMQGQVRNNIPQSFVISRDGRVVKRFIGFNSKETPPRMHQALEEALDETKDSWRNDAVWRQGRCEYRLNENSGRQMTNGTSPFSLTICHCWSSSLLPSSFSSRPSRSSFSSCKPCATRSLARPSMRFISASTRLSI